jgi:hypothetical protein
MKKIYFSSLLTGCLMALGVISANAGVPYPGPHIIPCVVQAEDFDQGGLGVAYNDDPGLSNGDKQVNYRPDNPDVEMENTPGADGPYIGSTGTDQNCWYTYTVTAPEAGNYNINLVYAFPNHDGNRKLTIAVNGVEVITDATIFPATGDYYVFTSHTVVIPLAAGDNEITIYLGRVNFDKFEVTAPYTGTPYGEQLQLPGTIEAEFFDKGGKGISYDSSIANEAGENNSIRQDELFPIGHDDEAGDYITFTDGDYVYYTVYVSESNKYLPLLVASSNGDGKLFITSDAKTIGEFDITSTDDAWQDVTFTGMLIDEGAYHFKLQYQGTGRLKLSSMFFPLFYSEFYPGLPYPFGSEYRIPCTVEAENFDEGKINDTYYDRHSGLASYYRNDKNVTFAEENGGTVITGLNPSEWFNYSVIAETEGYYDIVLYIKSFAENKVKVLVNGLESGSVTGNSTGNYDALKISGVPMKAGKNILTVYPNNTVVDQGSFDKFEISAGSYPGTPYVAQQIPGSIQAEFFDNGGINIAYGTSLAADGGSKNFIRQEEALPIREIEDADAMIALANNNWARYTINVSATDVYNGAIYFMNQDEAGTLNLYVDDELVTSKKIPVSDEWIYIFTNAIDFYEGEHGLKLEYVGNGTFYLGDIYFEAVDLTPTLGYDFEDATDLAKPTYGDIPLEFYLATENASVGSPDPNAVSQADGPTPSDKAIRVPQKARVKVINPDGPAANNGNRLTEFSVLYDFLIPDLAAGGGYHCLYTPKENNDGDGHMFVKGDGSIGKGAVYSAAGLGKENQWQRLIVTLNIEHVNQFLDGVQIVNATASAGTSFGDYFWIFTDNDGEDDLTYCSRFYFWTNLSLTPLAIKKLGLDGSPTAIRDMATTNGKVYAADGKLFLKGVSTSASVEVFSLVGQKVVSLKSAGDQSISLPTNGIYIVRITDNGKTEGFKVLVK